MTATEKVSLAINTSVTLLTILQTLFAVYGISELFIFCDVHKFFCQVDIINWHCLLLPVVCFPILCVSSDWSVHRCI